MLEHLLPYIALGCVVFGSLGLLLSRTSSRTVKDRTPKLTSRDENVVSLSDWQPTGRIDLGCSEEIEDEDQTGRFILRIEEYRTFQGPSRTARMELRWRDATLKEAKRIVVNHNGERSVGLHAEFTQSPSIVPPSAPTEASCHENRARSSSGSHDVGDAASLHPPKSGISAH